MHIHTKRENKKHTPSTHARKRRS